MYRLNSNSCIDELLVNNFENVELSVSLHSIYII